MGSWKENQYIPLVRVVYCKLPTNGKQLPAFPPEAVPEIGLRGGRRECYQSATVPPPPNFFIYQNNIFIFEQPTKGY